jgi:hypothetical protein
MTPLTAEEVEDLQIEAVVGAIALLFVADREDREDRRLGRDRRVTDRGELDRREVWDRR